MSCVASGRPAPRYAPTVVLFVMTLAVLNRTLGTSYTPTDIICVSIGRIAPIAGYAPPTPTTLAVEADDLARLRDTELGGHHEVATVHERDHVLGTASRPTSPDGSSVSAILAATRCST